MLTFVLFAMFVSNLLYVYYSMMSWLTLSECRPFSEIPHHGDLPGWKLDGYSWRTASIEAHLVPEANVLVDMGILTP